MPRRDPHLLRPLLLTSALAACTGDERPAEPDFDAGQDVDAGPPSEPTPPAPPALPVLRVVFRDNTRNLDSAALPLPGPVPDAE